VAGGALRRQVDDWRGGLVEASALLAAELDFSDESDVGGFSLDALGRVLCPLMARMDEVLRRAPASERLRDGFMVLILGPPTPASRRCSICWRGGGRDCFGNSGTTRDMIEVELNLGGMPVTLIDTAGLRETEDAVECIGVGRARARAGEADLLLWLSEAGAAPPP